VLSTFASASALGLLGQVTLPDVGIDVGDYITAIGLALGAVMGVALGVYGAFLLIRKGMALMRRAV